MNLALFYLLIPIVGVISTSVLAFRCYLFSQRKWLVFVIELLEGVELGYYFVGNIAVIRTAVARLLLAAMLLAIWAGAALAGHEGNS